MKPRVYIETTIPSFYYEVRSEAEMVARRKWTRSWWSDCRKDFEVVTSEAVLDELKAGAYDSQEEAIQLLAMIPLLDIVPEVIKIGRRYIDSHVMPSDPTGDALHLAVASYHDCRFLLTWNCRHLANANKFDHIHKVNGDLGLPTPTITTPLELLEKPDA